MGSRWGGDLYSPFTSVVDPGLDLCHKMWKQIRQGSRH